MLIPGNTHLPMMMGMVCTPSPPRQIGKRSPLRQVGMMPHLIKLPLRHTWVMLHQCNTSQEGHRGSTLVLMGGLAETVGEDAAIPDPLPTPMLGMQLLVSLHLSCCNSKHLQLDIVKYSLHAAPMLGRQIIVSLHSSCCTSKHLEFDIVKYSLNAAV